MKNSILTVLLSVAVLSGCKPANTPTAGASVPSTAAEQEALELVGGFGAYAPSHGVEAVILGAAIWSNVRKDAELSRHGKKTTFLVSTGNGKTQPLEGRGYSAKEEGTLEALGKSAAMKEVLVLFSKGKSRAATAAERTFFYAFIPFEIEGKPLTVVEGGGEKLVVYKDGGLLYLDLLSGYN